MSQLMEMIASMQASMNSRFDALDGKILDIQERVIRLEARGREDEKWDEYGSQRNKESKTKKRGNKRCNNRSLKENLQRSKSSLKTTRFYKDEVIKLKTLKTSRILRDSF
ncbi:hypothetical protein M9H77_03450 [Catharanthus roseus]|uniref:Uncharacterized protein n=1 Tax=Catharanthus roseus TaxID=4058 RepID=A0ACC0CB92_CATRO|nr:hypothetical protein M9H77_03450 [Catharanthus roseus]